MMGRQPPRIAKPCYYGLCLEDRIPPDHLLRKISAQVDFDFTYDLAGPYYGVKGNVSVPPPVLLKLMLLLFLYNVSSERELLRRLPYQFDWIWFLGYDFDSELPDHSVLSKACKRWGPEVFETIFARGVEQCVHAGLVNGRKIHLDGSLVDANASNDSVCKGPAGLIARLRQELRGELVKLDEPEPASAETPADAARAETSVDTVAAAAEPTPSTSPLPRLVLVPPEPLPTAEPAASSSGRSETSVDGGPDPAAPPSLSSDTPSAEPVAAAARSGTKKYYRRKNRCLVSTTDPDAAIVRKGSLASRARYKNHRAVDDFRGVITAVETTAGDVEENSRLMPLIEQHEQNTSCRVETVVADTQYGTAENFRACEQRGIASHMADLSQSQAGKSAKQGIFGIEQFVYDPATDTYRCPAGQTLTRRKHKKQRQAYEYACAAATCQACPLRPQCTRAKKPAARTIKRHYDQEAIDAAKEESHRPAAKRDRQRRKWRMEGSFGDATTHHGFKRARWRGLWRQQIQDWLIATVQNLRTLVRYASAPAREAAVVCASVLAPGEDLATIPARWTGRFAFSLGISDSTP